MDLLARVDVGERDRVAGRLQRNLMAWLTTVRGDGQPVSVPVWFLLREDGSVLLYSRPGTAKLRNIEANPRVSLALDVTDVGRNVVSLEGTARLAPDEPPADRHPGYLAKYLERMEALFGSSEAFAGQFTVALVITPARLRA